MLKHVLSLYTHVMMYIHAQHKVIIIYMYIKKNKKLKNSNTDFSFSLNTTHTHTHTKKKRPDQIMGYCNVGIGGRSGGRNTGNMTRICKDAMIIVDGVRASKTTGSSYRENRGLKGHGKEEKKLGNRKTKITPTPHPHPPKNVTE